MNAPARTHWETILVEAAAQLNSDETMPVKLGAILKELGVQWHVAAPNGRRLAEIALQEPPVLTIFKARQTKLSARERFSVAHEIGHLVLWKRCGVVPTTLDYWLHETLCNKFASALLLPTAKLREMIREESENDASALPALISRRAVVSWDMASRSIAAEGQIDALYLRLVRHLPSTTSPRFRVACSAVQDDAGRYVGQGAVLNGGELALALDSMDEEAASRLLVNERFGQLGIQGDCTVQRSFNNWWLTLRSADLQILDGA